MRWAWSETAGEVDDELVEALNKVGKPFVVIGNFELTHQAGMVVMDGEKKDWRDFWIQRWRNLRFIPSEFCWEARAICPPGYRRRGFMNLPINMVCCRNPALWFHRNLKMVIWK